MKRNYLLTAVLVASLMLVQGCSSSKTSTTTFTTNVTNENGETTTHTKTTTVEGGEVSTEESTVVTDADGVTMTDDGFVRNDENVDLRDEWHKIFNYGCEGVSEAGDTIFLAYDDPDLTFAAMMVIDKDNYLTLYDYGEVKEEDDAYVIYDVDGDHYVPFSVTESEDDYIVVEFKDGDVATLNTVDQDTIINDMVSVIEDINTEAEE